MGNLRETFEYNSEAQKPEKILSTPQKISNYTYKYLGVYDSKNL